MFLKENEKNLLREVGFSERVINLSNSDFKNILRDQFKVYLDFVKNKEESIIERLLNK